MDPIFAILISLAMIGVGGSLGRRSIGLGGALGGDGSHGTTMTLGTTDDVDPAMTQEPIVYTFTVTNTGAGALTGLSLAITIDVNSTYVSSNAGTFTSISGPTSGVITAMIASVAGGGTAVCTVTVTAPTTAQTLTLTSTATATSAATQNDTETTSVLLVSRDAASGWYFPASATEWANVGSCVGFTCTPFLGWDCQAASGNFADFVSGSFPSNNAGLTYHVTVSGFTRFFVTHPEAGGVNWVLSSSASLPDVASESAFVMWVGGVIGAGSGDKQMNILGSNPNAGALVRQAGSTNVAVTFVGGAAATVILSSGATIRPWGVQIDRTNTKNRGITDGGIAEPTWQSGLSGKSTYWGSGLTPNESCAYFVEFRGANAEFTRTQINTLWTRLRWGTVTWTP